MSLTQASTDILRRALAAAVVVPVTPYQGDALAQLGLCRSDVRPPSRPLPADIKAEVSGILDGWGLK
jgi:hypothetical protein